MTLLLALLVPGASAAPDHVATTWTVASPTEAVLSDSGDSVGLVGTAFTLLDLGTWTTTAVAVCSTGGSPRGLAAGTLTGTTTTSDAFWVGCGDGTVERVDVTDGVPALSSDVLTAGTTAVTATEYDGTSLFVVMQGSGGLADFTAISPADGTVASGYPTTLAKDSVNDTLIQDGSVYVVHGGDKISRITTADAAVFLTTQITGADYTTATGSASGQIFLTDQTGGGIWSFDTGSDGYTLHLSNVGDATTALALDETAGWGAISADTDLVVYPYASGAFGATEDSRLASAGSFSRLLDLPDPAGGGSVLLGVSDSDSLVTLVSDAPWVDITSAPTTAGTGDVSLTFTSDIGGDWKLWLGGTLSSATELDSGTIATGDTATATTTVDSTWIEGRNRLWVTVDDGVGIGHDAADVTVDTPPPQMAITVGFGESSVNVAIAASDTADLDHYEVYLSNTAFTAADYATGGPAYTEGTVSAPANLAATPSASGSYTFYPLTNGTTYWAAVRAYDTAGHEGAMSDVVSATPDYTYSASELRGDPGGFSCSSAGTSPGAGAIAGLVLSGTVALVGRRRRATRRTG